MPIRVQGPDGQQLEFPDGTPQETMRAAMQKRYGAPKPAAPKPPTLGQSARQVFDDAPWYERALIGAGEQLDSMGRGINQIASAAADQIPGVDLTERRARLQREADDAQQVNAGIHGVAGNVGRALPYLATIPLGGPEASLLARAPNAGRLAQAGIKAGAAALEGGGYGAIQQTGTGDSRVSNAIGGAAGGAIGRGVVSAAGAPARALAREADPYVQQLADKARAAGIELGVGELSSNPMVRTVVSQMERLPLSGGAARAERNRGAFTQAVGDTFGAYGDKLTPGVYGVAKRTLSDEFERLTANNSLKVQPQLVSSLANIVNGANKNGTTDAARVVGNRLDEFMQDVQNGNGVINGRRYQALDSDLGQQIQQFRNSDPSAAFHLAQLRDALRNAMDNSISPADKEAWKTLRAQWGNMKTVEPLVGKSADGTISPAALMQRVNVGAGAGRMATGKGGELGDLARIGQRFLKDAPNSGTADRSLINNLLANPITAIPAAAALGPGLVLNRLAVNALNRAPNSNALNSLLGKGAKAAMARRVITRPATAAGAGIAQPKREPTSP